MAEITQPVMTRAQAFFAAGRVDYELVRVPAAKASAAAKILSLKPTAPKATVQGSGTPDAVEVAFNVMLSKKDSVKTLFVPTDCSTIFKAWLTSGLLDPLE